MKFHNNKQPKNSGRISHPALGSTNQFVEREYARAVKTALKRKENLIIEAPVGTDRQAAYVTTVIEHAETPSPPNPPVINPKTLAKNGVEQ